MEWSNLTKANFVWRNYIFLQYNKKILGRDVIQASIQRNLLKLQYIILLFMLYVRCNFIVCPKISILISLKLANEPKGTWEHTIEMLGLWRWSAWQLKYFYILNELLHVAFSTENSNYYFQIYWHGIRI